MQSIRNPGKKTFEIRLKMEGEVRYERGWGALPRMCLALAGGGDTKWPRKDWRVICLECQTEAAGLRSPWAKQYT